MLSILPSSFFCSFLRFLPTDVLDKLLSYVFRMLYNGSIVDILPKFLSLKKNSKKRSQVFPLATDDDYSVVVFASIMANVVSERRFVRRPVVATSPSSSRVSFHKNQNIKSAYMTCKNASSSSMHICLSCCRGDDIVTTTNRTLMSNFL